MNGYIWNLSRPAGVRRAALVAAVSSFAVVGCDGLFDVENPTNILEEDIASERFIPSLANSAEGALSEVYDIAVEYGELPGDGVMHVSTNQGNLSLDYGILDQFNQRAEDLFNELAAAQWTAWEVTQRLEGLVPDASTDARVARSYYWDAVARITLADLFEEVPFDGGPPNTPEAVYVDAIDRLNHAAGIAQAAEATDLEAVIHGTVARAYRSLYFERGEDLPSFEQAAAAAQAALDLVADFSIEMRYQPPGSQNGLYSSLSGGSYYDVMGTPYVFLRDPVTGELDPRVQHGPLEVEGAFGDLVYHQLKYDAHNVGIPVSTWEEAVLILAEYALLDSRPVDAVTHINTVRNAAGLVDFASADPDVIQAQLIYERKAEFFLELRRWQDMRYYDIIPERWEPAMKALGVDRRFPVSLRERLTNEHYR